MLKRIALAFVFVVSAATVGASVAKAQSGVKAPTIKVDTGANGFCPMGVHC
jgi:hypothetical protein